MKRENQQDATIRCLLLTSISTCFGHYYAHLQENKEPVTAFGVLVWFCWMWLVAVVGRCLVGCEHYEGLIFVLIAFLYGLVTGHVPSVIIIVDSECNWNQYFNLFNRLLNELIVQAPGFVFIIPSAREAL
jgi:hypothetical protein